MRDGIRRISEAAGWSDYYQAFKDAYTEVLGSGWALGRLGFAQHLHHTAIQDVSGNVHGAMAWSVYSQPSHETLSAFLDVFCELLEREHQRIRSGRYLFFVTSGPAMPMERASEILGPLASQVDFWCGSLEEVISLDPAPRAAVGLEALFGARRWLRDAESFGGGEKAGDVALRLLRNGALEGIDFGRSVAPRALRSGLFDSCLILAGLRLGCTVSQVADTVGSGVGVGALIAHERAHSSGWNHAEAFLRELMERHPIASEDYVVKPGDILSRIVRERYETSYDKMWPLIRALNPELHDPNLIVAGRHLLLPKMNAQSGV